MKWRAFQLERLKLVKFQESLTFSAVKVVSYTVIIITIAALIAVRFIKLEPLYLGILIIASAFALLSIAFSLYLGYLSQNSHFLINQKLLEESPLNWFEFEALEIIDKLYQAKTWRRLYSAIMEVMPAGLVLFRLGINKTVIDELIEDKKLTDEEIWAFVNLAVKEATQKAQNRQITCYDLLSIALKHPSIKDLLTRLNIKQESLDGLMNYYQNRSALNQKRRRFWESENYYRTGGIAKEWAISYTNQLDRFTEEVNAESIRFVVYTPLFGRQEYLSQIGAALTKSSGSNVLLIGENGIGKKELFFHFAYQVLMSKTMGPLNKKQIRILDIPRTLSSCQTPNQLQSLMETLFYEIIRAGNIILFIDHLEVLLEPQGQLGKADLSGLLDSYLKHPKVKIVATISPTDYITKLKPNSLLAEQFHPIEIKPPSSQELEKIILDNLDVNEYRYKVFFTLSAIKALSELPSRYLKDQFSPKRELDLLEEVANSAASRGAKLVDEELVKEVLERKTGVPIQVDEQEREVLLNLAHKLHKKVIGQNRAIELISNALLRARSGLAKGNRPIGTFLFLGPTGVGKTETAKALADVYFGDSRRLIRLDMAEYADETALIKLLGRDAVNDQGSLALQVQKYPSAVLLFDEFEKSHSMVKNALLPLFDEGRLTTNFGKVLDFTNMIAIATSNAGANLIRERIEQGKADNLERELIDYLMREHIYTPELINRFDAVVVYLPLTLAEIKEVVKLRLEDLAARMSKEKGIDLAIEEGVIEQLARQGYDPIFGARALDRVIKEKLETRVAQMIVERQPHSGEQIVISNLE